ncbi:ImmA/IrrE family metallo-endopeptidase [Roseofilum sp. BLCC_M91]|uniref:ImmA/IrrE family metallo-endopeptidase n=1 Tax=Roseofilum halophilum BLCC-M91 TaxID=3022259 RepID=A0ABT7BMI5_9CYAN|nr:ImmA/IrrE family metallo-endopeptidase [Roseofilum halophilum]MDJ1180417.1 ImmA/IrrE family metallo-endopeptidase [Roseofilum halophilum BLCC-M91]
MAANILDTIDRQQLGKSLKQAREQRGMTQADAAQELEVSRTTLVAIENGTRRLKPAELITLARTYGRSVSDFVRPRPVVEPLEVQFRALYRRTQEEQAAIEPVVLRLQQLCENYLELEQLMGSPLPQNYPAEYDVEEMPIEPLAEAIATQERQRLGLGDHPIQQLRDTLEANVGLRIFYLPMPPKFSEIYSYNPELGGCLGINSNHPEERRRWSLAHGYLHFLAHRYKAVVDFDDQYQRMPDSEKLAEAFAKYFLMPTSSLLKQFRDRSGSNKGKFTQIDLFTLAHYYGVSVQALAFRLEEMKCIPTGTWDNLHSRGLKVRSVQQQLNLQDIPQLSDMTPVHYQHLAIEALDRALITEGQFAKFLGVNRLEARYIAEQLREYSSGILDEDRVNLREVADVEHQ